jgi:hypothetical protein
MASGVRRSKSPFGGFSSACADRSSPRDPGEIRYLSRGRADAREQRQPVGAHGLILIIHENLFEE